MFLSDLLLIIQWWLIILLFTVSAFPLACLIFGNFEDHGYSLSKIIAFLSVPYITFVLSTIHVLKFTRLSLVLSILIFILIEFLIVKLNNKTNVRPACTFKSLNKKVIIIEEIAFLLLLLFWSYLRGLHPELNTTEKYMDLGFINGILNSEYMPANDIWAAGKSLNYYYFGSFIVACLTKLSGINAEYTYNLMMATLFATVSMAVFTLVYGLLKNVKACSTKTAIFGGSLASVMVNFAGNLHYLIYGLIIPKLIAKGKFVNAEFLGIDDISSYSYYFPKSTRYVGYQPIVQGDRTITEFPIYSYVLSDLHAHVINLMAVILFLAVAYVYIARESENCECVGTSFGIKNMIKRNPLIILMGFLIGIFSMSNFWDYPIYLIVSIFFFGYLSLKKNYNTFGTIADLFSQIAIVLLIQYIVALPFSLNFEKMISGIALAEHHSKLYQLLVLWGVPLVISLIFIVWLVLNCISSKKNTNIVIQNNDNSTNIGGFSIELSDIFVIILIICAIGLVFGTEIVYVKDIYEENSPRSNTMFKLNYQAFVLFGIAVGYAVARIQESIRNRSKKIICLLALLILCSTTVIYSSIAISQWYGNRTYEGLNGIKFLNDIGDTDSNSEDGKSPVYKSVEWIRENTDEDALILETYGDSYSQNCFVSITTGRPTVIGWRVHEWLWRNTYDFVAERTADVDKIYTSTSKKEVQQLIKKYKISYIYVGPLEREKYGDSLNINLMSDIGNAEYEDGKIIIISIK